MSDPLFAPRQWARRREEAMTQKKVVQAVADYLSIIVVDDDTRRVDGLCDFCGGEVINNVCTTCESYFENGKRVREYAQCPKCRELYKIRDGHNCEPLPFDDPSEITS